MRQSKTYSLWKRPQQNTCFTLVTILDAFPLIGPHKKYAKKRYFSIHLKNNPVAISSPRVEYCVEVLYLITKLL